MYFRQLFEQTLDENKIFDKTLTMKERVLKDIQMGKLNESKSEWDKNFIKTIEDMEVGDIEKSNGAWESGSYKIEKTKNGFKVKIAFDEDDMSKNYKEKEFITLVKKIDWKNNDIWSSLRYILEVWS